MIKYELLSNNSEGKSYFRKKIILLRAIKIACIKKAIHSSMIVFNHKITLN